MPGSAVFRTWFGGDQSGALVCQGEGVQRVAHIAFKGLIDHLVLLHAGLAAKALGDHFSRIMVAVAGEVGGWSPAHPEWRP